MVTVRNIEWLAGFLDGEGCFYMNRSTCRIQIAQKDPWPLLKVQGIIGGRFYSVKGSIPGRRYHALFLTGRRAVGGMMTVYSLMSPRRQAKIVEILGRWRAIPLRGKCNLKTHCKRGHVLNVDTTFMQSNGTSRECRACSTMHKANWEKRRTLQVVTV